MRQPAVGSPDRLRVHFFAGAGAHVVVETSGKVKAATGLTTQGQGHKPKPQERDQCETDIDCFASPR